LPGVHWLLVIVAATGCSACQTPPPECTTTPLDTSCSPQYMPLFTNIYTNMIQPDCGSNKGSCHGNNGDSGLSFADSATAHQSLVDRINLTSLECSELIVRTHDTGQDYSMPPDSPLAEAERCALLQWVAAGAPP
jgi:hypothetical protein